MSRRQSAFAYLALILGVTAFASSFARPTVGQQPISASPTVGRYQIATSAYNVGPNLYVIDTVTGKTWERKSNNDWSELKPLPIAR